jgi:N-sulfoglucosamine sulfohydrolase
MKSGVLLATLVVLSCAISYGAAQDSQDAGDESGNGHIRNVILFLAEDHGTDLGCMGTVGLETPALDAFADSGVLFERAFCLSPVCSPSKMAMFTGTFPHENSACRNVPDYGTDFPLKGDPSNLSLGGVHEDLPTWIEILKDQGFYTAVSHKTHVQPIRKWPYDRGYGQLTTAAAARRAIEDLIARAGDRRFYMTFGIGAPHLPFRSILQNQRHWDPKGGLTGDGHANNVDADLIEVPECYPDVAGVRQDFADYYGAIECVDAVFGAVIDQLRRSGVLNQTLVIYTSDHGMGLHRAKQSIYPIGTRVPLIIAGPGLRKHLRIQAPVSHLDLLPTLLEILTLPSRPGLNGSSLMPILRGETKVITDRSTIMTSCHERYEGRTVCDGSYYYVRNLRKITLASLDRPQRGLNADQYSHRPGDYSDPSGPWFNRSYSATVRAVNSPQRKLLSDFLSGAVPDEELFDLEKDPWCLRNLANDPVHDARKLQLRKEMERWRKVSNDNSQAPDGRGRRGR